MPTEANRWVATVSQRINILLEKFDEIVALKGNWGFVRGKPASPSLIMTNNNLTKTTLEGKIR